MKVTKKAIVDHPSLNLKSEQRVCTQCRKKLAKRRPDLEECEIQVPVSFTSTSSSSEDDGKNDAPITGCSGDFEFHSPENDLQTLNKSLELLGESPIQRKRLNAEKYMKNKTTKIGETVRKKFETTTEGQWPNSTMPDRRWFNNLKKNLNQLRFKNASADHSPKRSKRNLVYQSVWWRKLRHC